MSLKFCTVISEKQASEIAAIIRILMDRRLIPTIQIRRSKTSTTLTTISPFAGQAALGIYAAFRLTIDEKVYSKAAMEEFLFQISRKEFSRNFAIKRKEDKYMTQMSADLNIRKFLINVVPQVYDLEYDLE